MQLDMHYYATYYLAIKSGIPHKDARIIAYSAQYVDDSTKHNSNQNPDGGLLYGIATAHHPIDCATNCRINQEEQRRVWVSFHFLPGGEGTTFEEKLVCSKNSMIAQEMLKNHISNNIKKEYQLYLIGIACHVFMDTFSHYGFSGISSELNEVENPTTIKDPKISEYVKEKMVKFTDWYNSDEILGFFAQIGSKALGHGGAMTLPDRPYLHWQFKYKKDNDLNSRTSERNNTETFIEGCNELYQKFASFAQEKYAIDSPSFNQIVGEITSIIHFEGNKEQRISKWKEIINEKDIDYDAYDWEEEKRTFENTNGSNKGINLNVYKFHQAAAYHRYYILKDLLPKHGIAIY